MDRIVIIGLGLIGGSLGLALKGAKLRNVEIVGVDISYDAATQAKKRSAVDVVERRIDRALEGAQLVVIATPIMAFRETFEAIAPYLPEGAVVTDTGSTKTHVMAWASELLPRSVSFVGGHPMAGKEVGGIESAAATLFQGATYAIMPAPSASKQAVELVAGLATAVGATPYFLDAEEHDMLVGAISHLPLVLSAALVKVTTSSPSWEEMSRLASSGYRDVSRLASSDPALSRGIGLTNQKGLLHWMDTYIQSMQELRRSLAEEPEQFLEELSKARDARDQWVSGKGQRKTVEPEPLPSAKEQMAEMFMGTRLAQAMRDLEPGPDRKQQ